MSASMPAPYFRVYGDYAGGEPVWHPRMETPWLATMEAQWQAIRQEFVDYHYARRQALTASYVPDDVHIRGWRSINFVTYRHWYRDNCARFPFTVGLLRAIPHLTSAFINLLEPHSVLPPHNGDTDTTYRCHLPLIVPSEDVEQCGLAVGTERTGWREGHAFAFNEAYRHAVWNHTDRDRVVMVFDVLKPAYRDRSLRICGDVLGAMTVTMLETHLPPLHRLPAGARRALHRGLGLAASGYLMIRDGAR